MKLRRRLRCLRLAIYSLFAVVTAPAVSAAGEDTVNTASISANDKLSGLTDQRVSQGQINIVKRARQLYEIAWTPINDRYQWNKEGIFKAGVTYHGVPYGQPVGFGYIGYNITPTQWLDAVNTSGGRFYSEYSEYNKTAPYYSADCSSFVSYAWGIPRTTSAELPKAAVKLPEQSIIAMNVGDILVGNGHAALVSAMRYNAGGELVSVDILEETPPIARLTRYGTGGTYALSRLQSAYLSAGFAVYRNPDRDSVKYTHDCACPIDGDYCQYCRGAAPFSDVSRGLWFYDAVNTAYRLGLLTGTSPTTFSPYAGATRAQIITVLAREAGVDTSGGASWYDRAVAWAKANGISDGSDLNGGITREQLVTLLWRASGSPAASGAIGFPDQNSISDWAVIAAKWAVARGIISGSGGLFDPRGFATRAQVAQIFANMAA